MLLLSRDNISLQVYHAGLEVQVTPPPGQFERTDFIYTYALGEELLAQLFLANTALWNPRLQLCAFFKQCGWSVEEVEAFPY